MFSWGNVPWQTVVYCHARRACVQRIRIAEKMPAGMAAGPFVRSGCSSLLLESFWNVTTMKQELKNFLSVPGKNFHPFLRLFLVFLPVALLICGGGYLYYLSQLHFIHEQNRKMEHETVLVGVVSINRSLEYVMQDVQVLYSNTDFRTMLDRPDKTNVDCVAADWVAFAKAKQAYQKIRWIDERGVERLRVNYADKRAYVVPEEELLDRKGRYFFEDTNALQEGEVYVSPLDLNIENNRIEEPFVPTIRFGMPVFNSKGQKRGILLLNYYADSMLRRFEQLTSMRGNAAWLVNRDGYWLRGPADTEEFGFMFDRSELSMASRYPQVWARIRNVKEGQFVTREGLWSFNTLAPLKAGTKTSTGSSRIFSGGQGAHDAGLYQWKVVTLLPASAYNADLLYWGMKIIGISLALLALFFLGILFVVRLQEMRNQLLRDLEKLVDERTEDLNRINAVLTQSEARLKSVFENIPDLIWLKDTQGVYLTCNQAFERFFNLKGGGIIGKTDAHLPHGGRRSEMMQSEDRHVMEDGKPAMIEQWATNVRTGKSVFFDVIKAPVRMPDGRLIGVLGIARDMTRRKEDEEKLQLAALVYRNSSEAILITNARNEILAVNPAFERITGYSAAEILGKDPKILSSGRQDKAFYKVMWNTLHEKGVWRGELWNRKKNGEVYAAWLTINVIYNDDGSVRYYVGLSDDFTEKKEAEDMIWRQANFDFLTDLPNRRMLLDRLQQETTKVAQSSKKLALLFLDLDNFKDVNDTLGHDMGDRLLTDVAHRLTGCVREIDTVSRLGSDEFAVILTELTDLPTAEKIAQKILHALAQPYWLDDEVAYLSASIGITVYPDDGMQIDVLLKNADQALYAAKQAGRNRMSYFAAFMQAAAQNRIRLSNDMRIAVEEHQFEMLYQPIVELETGKIHKAEALIRWHHPLRGIVSPAEFIFIAEETGLILTISDWAFSEVVREVERWRKRYYASFQISFNISPALFQDKPDYADWFCELEKRNMSGQSIVMEITEGVLLVSNRHVIDQLAEFHRHGMEIALDDFGTGYSSLSYLKKFDIEYLKIDQAFVRNIENEPKDMALCEAIIVMAHKLGMKVIAEGIQNDGQKRRLASAGCDYGQGYLFSEPLTAAEFENLLERNDGSRE